MLQKTNLMTLPRTFCPDVATKYLIEWCCFLTVTVQPAGTNKQNTLFTAYYMHVFISITCTKKS